MGRNKWTIYIQYADHIRPLMLNMNGFLSASYLLSAMDKTADPCNDFFQYACGDWNKKHVIPEDRTSISTFEVMADQLQVILKGIVYEIKQTTNTIYKLYTIYGLTS